MYILPLPPLHYFDMQDIFFLIIPLSVLSAFLPSYVHLVGIYNSPTKCNLALLFMMFFQSYPMTKDTNNMICHLCCLGQCWKIPRRNLKTISSKPNLHSKYSSSALLNQLKRGERPLSLSPSPSLPHQINAQLKFGLLPFTCTPSEQVMSFTYLGSEISNEGNGINEVRTQMIKASPDG